jgi:PIN domain nuclease of toxin-antitoxin system
MIYLSERGKMEIKPIQRLVAILNDVTDNYLVADLGLEVVSALARVPRSAVGDMPDRIVVATALELGLPLISRDAAIVAANIVPTIW